MSNDEFKALMEAAKKWTEPPSGIYPWSAKKQYKSVMTEQGIGLQPIDQPEFQDKTTKFIDAADIEIPDPSLIAIGEVATYINALSPVILTQGKDANGKWIILDGRHRLAAWRAAGYKQIPCVFMKVTPLPKFISELT
ncbi:MAG: ParB N-terminal domain-containing protein [Dehalococcoidales bacterium]|nr:ParB N-terminal domain-containing protein [Dehalococcoidales bacterium]